jgi:hypothetical protein
MTAAGAPARVLGSPSVRRDVALSAYRWVAIAGVCVDGIFALTALLAPDALGLLFGVVRVAFSHVWLGNLAVLLLARALFLVACARDAERMRSLAWLVIAGEGLISLYWLDAVFRAVHGSDLLPMLVVSAVFTVVPGVLLGAGLPPADGGVRAVVDDLRKAAEVRPRHAALLWFRRVALLGLIANAAFVLAVPFAPGSLRSSLGAQFVDLGAIWLGAVAVQLLAVSLLYLPAALDPESAPGVSWLLVASRVHSAA